jgi:hypothetical protein
MAGRPGTLPWNMATFTGTEPISRWSDNYNFLNNQINDSGAGFTSYAIDTGTANNMVVTLTSAPVAYEAGMMMCITPAFTNTGATVINANALGNVSILNPAGSPLIGGEISKSALLTLVYNGSAFYMLGPCARAFTTTTSATSVTVECSGCSSVAVFVVFTGAVMTLVLNHLSQGVPVTAIYQNGSGAPRVISMNATDPSGASFGAINAVQAGSANGTAFVNFISTGITLNNGQAMIFNGAAASNGILNLNH